MTLRLASVLALSLAAGCTSAGLSAPSGQSVTLQVEGEDVPLWTLTEVVAAGGYLEAIQSVAEGADLGSSRGGGTYLAIPASQRPDGWDYGFLLEVVWDRATAPGTNPTADLLNEPYTTRILARTFQEDTAWEYESNESVVAFERLEAVEGGIAVAGSYLAQACRPDEPADCLRVEGTFDLVVPDRRREPGTPAPEPLIL